MCILIRDTRRGTLTRGIDPWPPDGAPDGHGGTVGGRLLLRCDAVPLLSEAVAQSAAHGGPTAVASFHSAVAVGTASGATLVYMPRGLAADGLPSGCGTLPQHLFAPIIGCPSFPINAQVPSIS
jgi:hypothetical protein